MQYLRHSARGTGPRSRHLQRARRLSEPERVHEARNALTAIEGVAAALQTDSGHLTPGARTQLLEAVTGETRRLRRLLDPPRSTPPIEPFPVNGALTAPVMCARSLGTRVEVAVPNRLWALGRSSDTSQVVHNLLQNARRYAEGPVTITARLEATHVVVRVTDRGPGVAPDEARSIFRPGHRGTAATDASGDGLGLHICTRLMRGQGGDLRLEVDDSPGATFALVLRHTDTVGRPSATQPLDDPSQFGERVRLDERSDPTVTQNGQRASRGVEHEHGVGHDPA